jgi:hypothetical protein
LKFRGGQNQPNLMKWNCCCSLYPKSCPCILRPYRIYFKFTQLIFL